MRLLNPRRASLAAPSAVAPLHTPPASAVALSVQGLAALADESPRGHRAGVEATAGHGLRAVTNTSQVGFLAPFEATADPATPPTRPEDRIEPLRRQAPVLPLERLRAVGVARLPVGLIVHPGTPVRAISSGDLRRVPRGEITNRGEVGGRDVFIRVVAPRDGAGVAATVAGRVIGRGTPIMAPGQVRVRQASRVAAVVEQEPAAPGSARRTVTRGRAVADVVTPAPIEHELSFVVSGEPTPEAAAAIEASRAVAGRVSGG